MRLLIVHSLEFVEYAEHLSPRYGILSHRWQDQEVSYPDVINGCAKLKKGFPKLLEFCKRCTEDGLSLAWIDTCCIDKSSSAELSEAINSMYRWYQNATICYAYLSDVEAAKNDLTSDDGDLSNFSTSEWFARGWTLQELIAPGEVRFYDRDWQRLGTKHKLSTDISMTTGIPRDVLYGEDPRHYCIAQRMSWAAKRKTTRVEDQAYALMGLFDVNMPMLYGEGEKAFVRLQEEIMKYSADHSIFAWPGIITSYDRAEIYDVAYRRLEGLLATSPAAFEFCGDINWHQTTNMQQPFSVTNLGLSMEVLLRPCSIEVYEAKLDCYVQQGSKCFISIFLRQTDQDGQYMRHIFRGTSARIWTDNLDEKRKERVNIIQGRQVTPPAVCQPVLLFYRSPVFDVKSDSLPQTHIQSAGHYDSLSGIVDILTRSYGSVALLRTKGGHQRSDIVSLDFGFDFLFNPSLCLRIKSRKTHVSKGHPVPCNQVTYDASTGRHIFIVRKVESDGYEYTFQGHRGNGMLIWLSNLNAVINVEKKALMLMRCWTVDIQRAEPGFSHFLSWIDQENKQTKLLVSTDREDIAQDDLCPICTAFLDSPITTQCKHTFCQCCIRWVDVSISSTQLALISLNEAPDDEYALDIKQIMCPICCIPTIVRFDADRQWDLQLRYPTSYRQVKWRAHEISPENFPEYQTLTLLVGNTHKLREVTPHRHDWTFFVRPSNPECVADVKVFLHHTYKNNIITLSSPPFELRRFAWGFFDLFAEITLKPGFAFLHEKAVVKDDCKATLGLTWGLDFDGDGGQGWLKVGVHRLKPALSAYDEELRTQLTNLRALQVAARSKDTYMVT
ncbi:hypothetical protein LTR64_007668 [Lithohypha guttulata]|uniref:uncharacterized protein n=1 Tax=Lithohypha guttulata TaxID=1690604 RepID=UPI002DDDEFBB|nr:hypothetical protein LTR51_007177 [Lithohypha guttulata]